MFTGPFPTKQRDFSSVALLPFAHVPVPGLVPSQHVSATTSTPPEHHPLLCCKPSVHPLELAPLPFAQIADAPADVKGINLGLAYFIFPGLLSCYIPRYSRPDNNYARTVQIKVNIVLRPPQINHLSNIKTIIKKTLRSEKRPSNAIALQCPVKYLFCF